MIREFLMILKGGSDEREMEGGDILGMEFECLLETAKVNNARAEMGLGKMVLFLGFIKSGKKLNNFQKFQNLPLKHLPRRSGKKPSW